MNAFGTRNYGHHGSYCGLAFRMGSGAFLITSKPIRTASQITINVRFALFVGTARRAKRVTRLSAKVDYSLKRGQKAKLEYMVIDPALNVAANHSSGDSCSLGTD